MSTKLIIIIGVLCSSLSSVFGRFSDTSSTVLVFYRMLFTVLISVPLTVSKNKEELFSISKRNLLFSILSGALLGIHFVVYFTAVSFTSISSCTTLASMEAFFVAFALVFIFKEKVSAKSWIGIVVTFAGACLIAAGDFGSGNIKGDALAVLACVLVSSYTVIGRYVRKSGLSTNTYTCIVYTAAAVTVALFALATGKQVWPASGRTLLCSLGLTVFCTFLGHSIFSWGLKYVQASYISNAKMLGPVFATVWGILFFREVPGILGILGGITVISGVLYYSNNLKTE